jgi:hypothetical protein
MDKSLVSLRRRFVILGLFATTTVLFLAPRASASSFTSTFNLGSMNVSDSSIPPNFLTGPFNYGSRLLRMILQPPDKLRSIVFRSQRTRRFTTYPFTDQAPSIGKYLLVRLPLVLRPAR